MTMTYFSSVRSDKVYRRKIKITKYILLYFVVFLLSSCAPVMRVHLKHKYEYPPLEQDAHVTIYKKRQKTTSKHESLGKLRIVCGRGFSQKNDTTKCDSTSVFNAAECKTREIGGNALRITKFEKPTLEKEYYQLNANILKIFDFSSSPDLLHTKKKYIKSEIYGKGTLDLRLSLPYINHFLLNPDGENISRAGFLGAAIGLDYYHRNSQYLSALAGGVLDFFLPFPVHIDYDYGEEIVKKEFCSSSFISLTNNHRFKFFSIGYGLSYAHNSWVLTYNTGYSFVENNSYVAQKYTDNTLGLMFSSYWFINKSKFLNLGVIYRPSFYRLNTSPSFKYEHLLSIDFVWRIRLKTVDKQ